MYNFRCRTRIAGGFMIRDYVANQSKDNNKKADSLLRAIRLISLVIQEGFEPPTHGLEGAI